MTAWGLAWRTIARSPARSVLAVAGVTVIGALLFDMLLLSRGLLVSFRDLLDAAGFDIRVVAAEGLDGAPAADCRCHVAGRGDRAPAGGAARHAAFAPRAPRRLRRAPIGGHPRVRWSEPPRRRPAASGPSSADRRCRRSTDAGAPPPLVISPSLASELQLDAGLRRCGSASSSRVPPPPSRWSARAWSASAQFAFEAADDVHRGDDDGGVRRGARDATSGDRRKWCWSSSRAGAASVAAAAAIARLRPDLRVLSNDQVMEQFNQNAFSYFRQISTVLSSMTLAFAFLLIATLLTMSVNQRLGEVAALRALGFPRRRIAANLLWESVLLVGVGGLAALPVGGAAGDRARSHPAPDARRTRRGCISSSSNRGPSCCTQPCCRSPACWPPCIPSGSRRGCRLPRR